MSDENDEQGKLNKGELKELIKGVVAEVIGNKGEKQDTTEDEYKSEQGKTREERTGVGSISEQVRAEIARIKGVEERQQTDADVAKAISDLQQKTEEKPPVERRRVHRFMGWGENS